MTCCFKARSGLVCQPDTSTLHPALATQAERRARLVARFVAQARFCKADSPLYHHCFASLGRRLAEDDAFASWLLAASAKRASFDVPLLLLAGLHLHVLRRHPESLRLAAYYPSAGGVKAASDPDFDRVLAQAVDALQDELAQCIATSPVQTNEGARGLCWLLPLAYTGWTAVHLVELGASAGLNLVAEQRSYGLDMRDAREPCFFGQDIKAREGEFMVQGEGCFAPPPAPVHSLRILSRRGCDVSPIHLRSEQEATLLAAFVWPDQPARMQVLRQGIETVIRVNASNAPVRVQACDVTKTLPAFLQSLGALQAPCVLYNTYLTAYLPDKGRFLKEHIDYWARQQAHAVLWLQWEHLRLVESPAPEFGWLAWTADLWQQGQHQYWHLAWVHPHGSRVCWLPWFHDFAGIFAEEKVPRD